MIITDTSPSPNKDTKTNPADVTVASMSAPPPPPYPQAPHPHQSYQPYPYYNPTPFVERRRSPAKRFWGAFGVALLIWVLFAMFTDSFIQMTRGIGHRFFGDGQVGAPWPSDGDVETCVGAGSWSESYISSWVDQFPHHASTSFDLDVNSDVLRLLSRGSQQYGVVNIKQSNEVGDNVRVDVVVGYYYEEILNRATVCQLKRGESDHGIGIFTPTVIGGIHTPRDSLRFDVTFTLPDTDEESLNIKEFDTQTSLYEYKVDQLYDVLFKKISLKTSNTRINVGAIVAEVGSFETSNSNIEGHFNATSSLTLRTSNGPIIGVVDISNDPTSDTESAVVLKTSNSRINTSIKLASTNGTHGLFKVDATTANGAVDLSYADSPVDSTLKCNAHSSNSRVDIRMHQAFEGAFGVSTSNSHASVERLDKEDPSGKGRRRIVDLTRNRFGSQVSGNVYWQDGSHRGSGFVKVSTSNGAAKLTL